MIDNLDFDAEDHSATFTYTPHRSYNLPPTRTVFYVRGQGEAEPSPYLLSSGFVALSGPYPEWPVPSPFAPAETWRLNGVRREDDLELFALAVQFWMMLWYLRPWGVVEPFDPGRSWGRELAIVRRLLDFPGGPAAAMEKGLVSAIAASVDKQRNKTRRGR